ncbi:MAG: NUDIX domain-containing protein [Hyphomicrobium sp.]
MAARQWIGRGMQRYWRLSRGLTMGAQGCVLDGADRVLLVRHSYRPGWHFPGGGVEKQEAVEQALARELLEEVGVSMTKRPVLFGIFAHHPVFPSDHIALYVIREWRQPEPPAPNREIAEHGFFAAEALPANVDRSTAARIVEILEGRQPPEIW